MTLGNFFNIANIRKPRDIYTVRQERIKREGSPYYTWIVPATAAADKSCIHVQTQFPTSRKYEPLDWLEIVNNEAVNGLTLTINSADTFPVPAGTIRTIEGKALWAINVTNNGAVITTLNNIILTLRRQPMTIDKWAGRQR
jgi:hypothetical protein